MIDNFPAIGPIGRRMLGISPRDSTYRLEMEEEPTNLDESDRSAHREGLPATIEPIGSEYPSLSRVKLNGIFPV
jgi:hypothetical protein